MCGNAWCLADDLARARKIWPDAPVIAVNGAAEHLKALALFTQHPRKFPRWIAQQRSRHGEGFTTHAAGKAHVVTKLGKQPRMPWVDYWWDGVACGGTSGWGARRLARFLGFDLAILCGIPLETGGYFDGSISKVNRSEAAMKHYREQVLRDTDMHDGVVSLSGWTREVFGDLG